ncbi:MAG TPA: SRPBCC family protein [Anaerolineales bacterium]|nr:SRPBCC family protein [Anaerolineales bacterium]
MKFTLELRINKSRAEVWKAFDTPENMKKWQPSLILIESVSGMSGQPDAVSKLTYKENEREFSLVEKITHREELTRLESLYENNFADNTVKNTFIEKSNEQTLWVVETKFKFKTLAMRILGPLMKKKFIARTQKDMERFKEMAESQ